MKLAVIGTGYVGLVTGACLAEIGHEVVCMDVDADKIKRLRVGEIPIYEPGLSELVHKNQEASRLAFTTELAELGSPQAVFLALPTPPGEDGSADLSYVLGAAAALAEHLKEYTVLINKSTVPVGTAQKVAAAVSAKTKTPFDVVSNPEFLREGTAAADFMEPDRIVVGVDSARAQTVMESIYHPLTVAGAPLLIMDTASSEMTKYAANSFLATKISFMNEIANLCELVGANTDHVKEGIGLDQRIGRRFLNAGLGYGGSCFPKDLLALENVAQQYNYHLSILATVRQVNSEQAQRFVDKILKHYGGKLGGKRLAVWGLAFKANTDDVRQSPALQIVQALAKQGAALCVYDPEAMDNARQHALQDLPRIAYAKSAQDALQGTRALVILTEWEEFASVTPEQLAQSLADKTVFDGRNLFEPAAMRAAGLTYVSVGRPA